MENNQQNFIRLALSCHVLKFGAFELKSGRISPYFFNAGLFNTGEAFCQLANFYAHGIEDAFKGEYDVLFGPAYKGISLATAASIGLNTNYQLNVPVSFNRKEAKTHGEGGNIIGASLKDQRVLLIDDVITAGITIRESVDLITAAGGRLMGIVIALDRCEKGVHSDISAIQEVEKTYDLRVKSIINLHDVIKYLADQMNEELLAQISAYHLQYGSSH